MTARPRSLAALAVTLAATLLPSAAFAHSGADGAGGFASGFLHPLAGVDHVLAMVAVGLWGAQLGPPALWVLPVAFPIVMALGGVAGIVRVPLPSVEWGIALSVIVLGSVIALDKRPRLALAAVVVAFFAVFHGYAHGAELPEQAGPLAYSAGFVVATGTLHLSGIGLGLVARLPNGLPALRAGGSAIAAAGLYLAWRLLAA